MRKATTVKIKTKTVVALSAIVPPSSKRIRLWLCASDNGGSNPPGGTIQMDAGSSLAG